MEQKVEIDRSGYALDLLTKLDEFRRDNLFCDFVIKAGAKEIPVHRYVISASSEYFNGMLSNDTKEKKDGIVEIKQADPVCVEKCIEFMYTGEAEVSTDKQGELMHVAHMMRLHRLYNGIALFLQRKLNCESFFETRAVANLYECLDLQKVCDKFALDNFRKIALEDDFVNIEPKYLEFLLTSKDLMEPEGVKCKALMVWINHDSKRATSIFNMIKHIDLSIVPSAYKKYLAEEEPAFYNSIESLRHFINSLYYDSKIEATDYDLNLQLEIVVFDKNSAKMKKLDPKENCWAEVQELSPRMIDHRSSVVVLEEHLYAFVDDRETYRIKFRDANAVWQQMSSRKGRWGPVVVLKEYVYAIDYYDSHNNRVECYDPAQNQWTYITNRLKTTAYSAITAVAEHLFVIGGHDGSRSRSEIEMFHTSTSTWRVISNIRQPRHYASIAAYNDSLYIFGGTDSETGKVLSNMEIFTISTNTIQWVELPGFSRQKFLSHVIGRKIFLVGGNSSSPETIDEFDMETRKLAPVLTLTDIKMASTFSSACLPM